MAKLFSSVETWCRTVQQQIPWKIVLGTVVEYKKVFRIHQGEYVQVHQEDEHRNKIHIYRTVRAIVLGPQYSLQGGYFFESVLTGKLLLRSHWTPVNINEDVIEHYGNLKTKRCPDELLFGDFHDQPIPPDYYDLLNDDDENGKNITGNTVDDVLTENK